MHSQEGDRALLAIWGHRARGARGPRARFDLSKVAAVAVARADREGLDAVSLARVADDLHLTTTALYRYVDSKNSLLEVMVDAAVGPPPDLPTDDWQARTHAWSRSLWDRYKRHPWLADAPTGGMPRYPNRLAWIDRLLDTLSSTPVTDPMRAALLLDSVARTFAQLARTTAHAQPAPSWLLDVVAERHPRLSRELDGDWTDFEQELDAAVDIVLHGVVTHLPPPPS